MQVVDASVAAFLFIDPADDARADQALARLNRDGEWLVPEHWRLELFSFIRGLGRSGQLDKGEAQYAVTRLEHLEAHVVPTPLLLPRMWELRDSLSGYDAAYVAAAEFYGCALVTADTRIARSGAARCQIDLIA